MSEDKAVKVTVSMPEWMVKACRSFADREHGGNFSKLVQQAVQEHLEEHGAIDPDEREVVLKGIETAFSIDELKQLLSERAAATAETEGAA